MSTSKKAKDHSSLTGGGQEKEMRSTTENVAGIAATAKALRLAMENQEAFASKTQQMKEVIREELAKYPDVTIFSGGESFCASHLDFRDQGEFVEK